MAYISFQPSDYFNTVLYTGNGSTQSITGVGFQPDWTWIKRRNSVGSHALMDSSRGASKFLESDGTAGEATFASSNFAFTSDGYDLDYTGGYNNINQSGTTYVGWNWLANGGTTSSNTDGDITATQQVNTTAGFSISTYTGNGTTNQTIGHGLGVIPDVVITKRKDDSEQWGVSFKALSYGSNVLFLESTAAKATGAEVVKSGTNSTTVQFGADTIANGNTLSYVMYCFAEKKGFSKFGSYTGNGSADGTFIYTGFKPAMIIIKRSDSAGENWTMFDNKRDGYNVNNDMLKANNSETEDAAGNFFDLLSNGFKVRESAARHNASGGTYTYMAFAEHPLVASNGLPATAR